MNFNARKTFKLAHSILNSQRQTARMATSVQGLAFQQMQMSMKMSGNSLLMDGSAIEESQGNSLIEASEEGDDDT
ncbi:UNKNOWN [Stylonychia lemnae]|uniref:Uncharacterized protein n=1 Tax=Stylonychia lemnae TaxID=5949 RepID=A0A078A1M0_STYLE|nr:UNKNOWN [Stylonychia lemnae]|eukprot:CDW75742.1 UNKNOWN [Stylonychia lemnae]